MITRNGLNLFDYHLSALLKISSTTANSVDPHYYWHSDANALIFNTLSYRLDTSVRRLSLFLFSKDQISSAENNWSGIGKL
jgi:hypothetical protein